MAHVVRTPKWKTPFEEAPTSFQQSSIEYPEEREGVQVFRLVFLFVMCYWVLMQRRLLKYKLILVVSVWNFLVLPIVVLLEAAPSAASISELSVCMTA